MNGGGRGEITLRTVLTLVGFLFPQPACLSARGLWFEKEGQENENVLDLKLSPGGLRTVRRRSLLFYGDPSYPAWRDSCIVRSASRSCCAYCA